MCGIGLFRCFVGLLVLAFLLSCQSVPEGHVRTDTGRDLGKSKWEEIPDAKSVMYILDAPKIRRIEKNEGLYDKRYQERITLATGYIAYEKAPNTSFDTTSGLKELLYNFVEKSRILRERNDLGITRSEINVRSMNGIDFAYVVKQTESSVCFVFKSVFGSAYGVNSLGNQHVVGAACYPFGIMTVSKLETEWLSLLERLRFDGPKPGWALAR